MGEIYLNNKNLKAVGVQIEWTEEQILEYKKCSEDIVYFAKTYCKVVHIDRGLVNFNLYDYQEEMIDVFEKNRFSIVRIGRQSGKSVTAIVFLLHSVLFKSNYSIAILANKERQANELLSRLKLMYEYLPKWLQQGVLEWNKGNIELENGSKILASATSSSATRGGSFSLILLDEFAHVPPHIQEEFFMSVYPTISSGKTSKVIITSTPNGFNMFYKIWTESEQGRNSFARYTCHWSRVPGRDEAWKEETIRNTSAKQFSQEYEISFIGSSNTLIDPKVLERLTFNSPIITSGDIDAYEDVQENHVYLTVVDTSRGSGLDFSAFIVFDITEIPYKVVAKYRNNEISSLLYPNFIYNVSKHYNDAYILVETNDIGQQVADILLYDMEYENVLTTRSKGRAGQAIGSGAVGTKFSLGVRTTTQVKRIGCANFKSLVENDKIILNDYNLIYEIARFIEHNKSFEAEEGEHDDLVMCCVLFSWLVHQDYFKELSNNDARMRVFEQHQQQIEDWLVPFGYIDQGADSSEEETFVDPDDAFEAWFNGNF